MAGAGGCSTPAHIHPDFAAVGPSVIDVRQPLNATVRPLHEVKFGQLVQRLITGSRTYDVPALLGRALRDVLVEKGYQTTDDVSRRVHASLDFTKPLTDASLDVAFDCVLFTSIEDWSLRTTAPSSVDMRLRVELYKVPSGDLLYSIDVPLYFSEQEGQSQGRFLEPGLERAARRVLADLPAKS